MYAPSRDRVAVFGVRGRPVVVEAHAGRGLPSMASAFEDVDAAGSEIDALILRAFMAIGMPRERLEFLG